MHRFIIGLSVVVTIGALSHACTQAAASATTRIIVMQTTTPNPTEIVPVVVEPTQYPLQPDETLSFVPHEVWIAAVRNIAPERQVRFLKICYRESRFDPTAVNETSGARGACQIMERFHGSVPDGIGAQFAQADEIASRLGFWPWAETDFD